MLVALPQNQWPIVYHKSHESSLLHFEDKKFKFLLKQKCWKVNNYNVFLFITSLITAQSRSVQHVQMRYNGNYNFAMLLTTDQLLIIYFTPYKRDWLRRVIIIILLNTHMYASHFSCGNSRFRVLNGWLGVESAYQMNEHI